MRTVEARARTQNASTGAGKPPDARRKRMTAGVHPDQLQVAQEEISDALGAALGAEVSVRPARDGGYRAELSFATPQEAIELARRLRPRAIPGLLGAFQITELSGAWRWSAQRPSFRRRPAWRPPIRWTASVCRGCGLRRVDPRLARAIS